MIDWYSCKRISINAMQTKKVIPAKVGLANHLKRAPRFYKRLVEWKSKMQFRYKFNWLIDIRANSWFSRITPKPLQISTKNAMCLVLHQCDIEWPNFVEIGRNIFEKLTFLSGHFTPILTKTGSMLRNLPKIEFYSKPHKKTSIDVKWHALQNVYLETKNNWVFNPHNLEKLIFLGNPV